MRVARAFKRLGYLGSEARGSGPLPRAGFPVNWGSMGFVNWVSSTGSAVRVSSQASHSPRLSRLPTSLNKEGNAACARQVCRKVTTRETRDQRRISTWYQNLRVLSAQVTVPSTFPGASPECSSADPILGFFVLFFSPASTGPPVLRRCAYFWSLSFLLFSFGRESNPEPFVPRMVFYTIRVCQR